MPTFYRFNVNPPGSNPVYYSFDDVFIPIDFFSAGTLFSWGINGNGQLGLNDLILRNSPNKTYYEFNDWKKISSGSDFIVGIRSGYLATWGNGSSGQLGNGTINSSSIPVILFTQGSEWMEVSAGYDHAGAIRSDGSLWMWGNNSNYQIAAANQTTYNTPTQVIRTGLPSTLWVKISCGNNFTLGIRKDNNNSLWGWGTNQYGQLGRSDANSFATPTAAGAGSSYFGWKEISCGNLHSLGIKTDGSLQASGRNNYGQLGLGNTTDRIGWNSIGGTNWKQVSCGSDYSAAIKTDGTLWTWGRNNNGQLGLGDTDDRLSPVKVGNEINWKQVSCGNTSVVAVKTDGSLWVWGLNDQNQLGLGNGFNSIINTPQQIGTEYNWRFTSVGYSNFYGIKYQNDYF